MRAGHRRSAFASPRHVIADCSFYLLAVVPRERAHSALMTLASTPTQSMGAEGAAGVLGQAGIENLQALPRAAGLPVFGPARLSSVISTA